MAHHHQNYMNPSYDFTDSTSLKIKSFLRSRVLRRIHHVVLALTSAKSKVMELLSKRSTSTNSIYRFKQRRRTKKELFSSIRPYLHWSSSHIIPVPEPSNMEELDITQCLYYDSTWNSMISTEDINCDMEQHPTSEASTGDDEGGNDIDRLAEKFIASCHEKFRLEKQESYRRYQEMLARSM